MALSPYTAQCPNCSSEIDLSQAEMEMADGDIICGNCDHQFHAPNFLLKGFYSSKKKNNQNIELQQNDIMATSDFDPVPGYSSFKRRSVIKKLMMFFSIVVLGIALSFQVLWSNFDRWASKQNLRPFYSFLCSIEQLRCRMPAFVESLDVRLEDFTVNVSADGIYVIQARLTNYASVYNDFPLLEVVFSDIDNYPVANNMFNVLQYLGPNAQNEQDEQMLPGKNYDVLLEIVPPSLPVARYEVNVVSAI